MELRTIEMDRAEARKMYLEYRDAVRDRQDSEMAEIMRGYRAIARGHQVIDLAATIRAGGSTTVTRRNVTTIVPRLAVAQADQAWCWVDPGQKGQVTFSTTERPSHNATRCFVRLPEGTLPEQERRWSWRFDPVAKAMVPPVPPRFLPAHSLAGYHVLWEAEWEPVPPVDPALLKHIGGDLYAVLATWDLTDLERTVLARRFR